MDQGGIGIRRVSEFKLTFGRLRNCTSSLSDETSNSAGVRSKTKLERSERLGKTFNVVADWLNVCVALSPIG